MKAFWNFDFLMMTPDATLTSPLHILILIAMTVFVLRRFITATCTPRTLVSGCALAALTVLSAGRSCHSWNPENQALFKQRAVVNSSTITTKQFSTSKSMSSSSNGIADTCTSTFTVAQFPCLGDNYGYLLHDSSTGQTAAIDTPCAKTYQKELNKRGWKLTHIFNTHHHHDHTGGNLELKNNNGDGVVVVHGPLLEKSKIPGIDKTLQGGDSVEFGQSRATIIDVGGHTSGHIAYHFPEQSSAFVGDSLFVLGCGKMFEGTAPQFWESLQRLRALADETIVYWYVHEERKKICFVF
jgi:hydroxyacylglutathione hydrolase